MDRDHHRNNSNMRDAGTGRSQESDDAETARIAHEVRQYLQSTGTAWLDLQSLLLRPQDSFPIASSTTNAQVGYQRHQTDSLLQFGGGNNPVQAGSIPQLAAGRPVSSGIFDALNQISFTSASRNVAVGDQCAAPMSRSMLQHSQGASAPTQMQYLSSSSQPHVGPQEIKERSLSPTEIEKGTTKTISQGATIIPCRARGISKDHNAKTAYFLIPKDLKHGDGLLCSHIKCQNKGIRFVYCEICDQPVAKINFSTRHKHLELLGEAANKQKNSHQQPAGQKRKTTTAGQTTDNKKKLDGTSKMQEQEGRNGIKNDTVSCSPRDNAEEPPPEEESSSPGRKQPFKIQRTGSNSSKSVSISSHSSDNDSYQPKRKSLKQARLQLNPTSINSSSSSSSSSSSDSSKQKVSSSSPPGDISDSAATAEREKTESGETNSASSTSRDSIEANIEKEWNALLKERPNRRNREKMKAWLGRVLFTSEYMAPKASNDDDTTGSSPRQEYSSPFAPPQAIPNNESTTALQSGFSELIVDGLNSLESLHRKISRMEELSGNTEEPPRDGASTNQIDDSSSTKSHSAPSIDSNHNTIDVYEAKGAIAEGIASESKNHVLSNSSDDAELPEDEALSAA